MANHPQATHSTLKIGWRPASFSHARYRIILDGVRLRDVLTRQFAVSVKIAPGDHRVEIRSRSGRSNVFSFSASPGETVELGAGHRADPVSLVPSLRRKPQLFIGLAGRLDEVVRAPTRLSGPDRFLGGFVILTTIAIAFGSAIVPKLPAHLHQGIDFFMWYVLPVETGAMIMAGSYQRQRRLESSLMLALAEDRTSARYDNDVWPPSPSDVEAR